MNKKYLNQKDREKLFDTWIANVSPCAAVVLPDAEDLRNRAAALKNRISALKSRTETPTAENMAAMPVKTAAFLKNGTAASDNANDKPTRNADNAVPTRKTPCATGKGKSFAPKRGIADGRTQTDDFDAVAAENYLECLQDVLNNKIPPFIRKIAVTKMDSAPAPVVQGMLNMLQKLKNTRFDMIYLNTDGTFLPHFKAQDIYKAFHGLNIAIYPENANARLPTTVNGANGDAPKTDLKSIIKPLRANMVCILHYIFDNLNAAPETPDALVKHAEDLGFYALTLRFKPSAALYMGDLPRAWDKYPTVKYALAPAGRVWVKKKGHYPFIIRSTVSEPKNNDNYLYGCIIRPDLALTQDWAGKVPFADKSPSL